MLEFVVALLAGLLVVVGLVIIAGPALPRLWGSLDAQRRHAPASSPAVKSHLQSDLNPATAKALQASEALIGLFQQQGAHRQAAALRLASRRLQVDEPRGLYAMQQVLRQMRSMVLKEAPAQARFADLVGDLQLAVADRSEQLELLPRS
ncbi:MAG TPA: hypothetical protein VMU49_02870 [Candidatus Acidoferrales bacterium]|nr:hypothetical protein [Candidatus Acidoferrales bacterium]